MYGTFHLFPPSSVPLCKVFIFFFPHPHVYALNHVSIVFSWGCVWDEHYSEACPVWGLSRCLSQLTIPPLSDVRDAMWSWSKVPSSVPGAQAYRAGHRHRLEESGTHIRKKVLLPPVEHQPSGGTYCGPSNPNPVPSGWHRWESWGSEISSLLFIFHIPVERQSPVSAMTTPFYH